MRMMNAYHYANFPFMIFGTVPLMIVVSWGAIIYAVMRTSDHYVVQGTSSDRVLRWYLKPINDGLLALTIDLSLDPVAIQLGYWVWTIHNPQERSWFGSQYLEAPPWFGAPFGNYYGWYAMVFWYSFIVRLGFRLFPPAKYGRKLNIIIPLCAALVGLPPLFASLFFYVWLVEGLHIAEPIIFSLLLGLNIVAILRFLPELPHDAKLDFGPLSSPIFFHIFMLVMLYATGLFLQTDGQPLVILVPTIAAFSLICFYWPYLNHLKAFFQSKASIMRSVIGFTDDLDPLL
jgi:hypothetical protein